MLFLDIMKISSPFGLLMHKKDKITISTRVKT